MKYRLGLDLGVGSIGSAVVALNDANEATQVIDAGVRIFEVSEGAEERREKRAMRKNVVRTRERLQQLAKLLHAHGLWDSDTTTAQIKKLRCKSPYQLRALALDKSLENPFYIGRILLHLAKHRGAGFVEAAAELSEDKASSGKSPYETLPRLMQETNSRTVGEYFYRRLQAKQRVRQRTDGKKCLVEYAIPRYLVKEEFDQIWQTQRQYFKEMTDSLKKQVYDALFYEKGGAPYAVGKCIYVGSEDRLLKAHPLSEQRRLYETVNNIRLVDAGKQRRPLTLAERDTLIDLLMQGENVGVKKIQSALNLSKQYEIIISDENKPIPGYFYGGEAFRSFSESELIELAELLGNPIDPKSATDPENRRLYTEDGLVAELKKRLPSFTEEKIGKLLDKVKKNLKGRSSLGKTATLMILDGLKKAVVSHREVADQLSHTDPRFMAEEEQARQMQGKWNALPYYGAILRADVQEIPPLMKRYNASLNEDEKRYGKIANPAVHMILNQVRKVVNEIVSLYGKPYQIFIEVGRDVMQPKKEQDRLKRQQKENEKINQQAKAYLEQRHLPVTPKNILKYKLATEQHFRDAYNPGKEISQCFDGFDIEHIIPRAKGGTNTPNNLCLVDANDNKNKGDLFAYEYFMQAKSAEEIREILKFAEECLPQKLWRFQEGASQKFHESGDEEEINRYLTDTRYVAKMALRYLRAIVDCNNLEEVHQRRIFVVRGSETSELRYFWNLDGLEYDLLGLNEAVPKQVPGPHWINERTGEIKDQPDKPDLDSGWRYVETKSNPDWRAKPRIDHRHHALDAIVIACSSGKVLKALTTNTPNKTSFPLPFTETKNLSEVRAHVFTALKQIRLSHKTEHGKNGQLHKETGRVFVCDNPDDKGSVIVSYKRPILDVVKSYNTVDKLLIPNKILDAWDVKIAEDRKALLELKDLFVQYWPIAEQELIQENVAAEADGMKPEKISAQRIAAQALNDICAAGKWKGQKFPCYENNSALIFIEKHGVFYELGNNYAVDFYVDKNNKVGWELIRRFDAMKRPVFVPIWRQQGLQPLWSVHQGDVIELDTPETWQKYASVARCLARVKKFSDGRMSIDYISDARMTSPPKGSPDYFVVDSLHRRLSFFTQHHAAKVELTAFGRVKRKHRKLWDGKKAEK